LAPLQQTQQRYDQAEVLVSLTIPPLQPYQLYIEYHQVNKSDDQLTSAIIKEMGYVTILADSRQLNISVQEFLALSVGTVRGIESQHDGE